MTKKLVLSAVAALMLVGASIFILQPEGAAASARAIVEECAAESNVVSCYEKKVPALYPATALPDIFAIVREIRRLDPSYQFCHVLAHKLGENIVAEDPTKWIDAIPMNPPDGLCSNGFIHGVIVGRFRNDVLDDATLAATIPDFARACESREDWKPSGLDQGICYHGMGHLFMFITSADIRKSLEVCEQITSDGFMRVCREGVFMQIYQPLEPDDFALIELLPEKPTAENYRRLCSVYGNDEDEGACLREAWPMFREEMLKGNVRGFCSGQPNVVEEDRCYETSMTIIGRQLLGNSEQAVRACNAVPTERKAYCFVVVAQALLEEDRTKGNDALAVCSHAPDAGECIGTLASRANWLFSEDSNDRENFCSLLPEEYRGACGRR